VGLDARLVRMTEIIDEHMGDEPVVFEAGIALEVPN
jgi:hypothetical protein